MTHVCYAIPSLDVGGTERQLILLISDLIRDHEISVICTRQAGSLASEAQRLGARVHVLGCWGGWDFRMHGRVRRIFRQHRPDIVHTFLFGFDLPVNRAARETGVPVILSSRRELGAWMKPRHIRRQRKANLLVHCIVANSRAVAEYAMAQEGEKAGLFRVIHNGVVADRFISVTPVHEIRARYGFPESARVVGMAANFSPVKDHALFLCIAQELVRRRKDVHFLLVGSGPLRSAVEAKCRALGLAERFTCIATSIDMADLYAVTDVSVLCSKAEGFPNAILESMAAGKPVVAAAVGGVPELVHDGVTGRLVSTRNPADFADAIEWVLDHPEEAKAMGCRAAEHVRAEFSVEKMAAAYRQLYGELPAHSGRRD